MRDSTIYLRSQQLKKIFFNFYFHFQAQNGDNTSSFEMPAQSISNVSSTSSNSTGHLTVEKYILQLQQKDERVRKPKLDKMSQNDF